MIDLKGTQTVPLVHSEDGTIRVTGSRVTLDSIVGEFKRGSTAEEIQQDFPSLSLRQVYGAISYYLDHVDAVEEYLAEQRKAAEATQKFIETQIETGSLRRRLRELRCQAPR